MAANYQVNIYPSHGAAPSLHGGEGFFVEMLRCSLRKRSKVADDNEMPGADLLSALPITTLRRSVGISGLARPG